MTFGLIASLDRMFPYLKTLFKENNMKKLLVFALFLGLGTSAYAQSPMGGKLETGLNFSYGMPMDKDMKDSVKASPIYGLLGIAQYNYKWDGGEKKRRRILPSKIFGDLGDMLPICKKINF